ncbi:hypothetical protein KIP88_43265 [Bradyrhizobium sp. SRL28]|nr:hypothetical protein [Bradyrhizobium sp. SRL28]MBT1517165.1 hypothetical protein [Bradyrhizobium sp. SRL28]
MDRLLRDNHTGYVSWQKCEDNQKLQFDSAYMEKIYARKSAVAGRVLLIS